MSTATIRAPALAMPSAMASPMPDPAPVTSAIRPASNSGIWSSPVREDSFARELDGRHRLPRAGPHQPRAERGQAAIAGRLIEHAVAPRGLRECVRIGVLRDL